MTFAMELEQLELGLDALDAYAKRRPSHAKARSVGTVLAAVHKELLKQKELGLGGDEDDW